MRTLLTLSPLICLLWIACVSGPACAADLPAQKDLPPIEETMGQQAAEESDADPVNTCRWGVDNREFQEQSRNVVRGISCYSLRWFDGLFGEEYEFDESKVNGMLTIGADYSQFRHFDHKLRLRVSAPLPNASDRWNVLLGRLDEADYITDTQLRDPVFYNPGIAPADDSEWLLGLGYRGKSRKKGWDFSLGARLRVPPHPYAKAQYYYNKAYSESTQLRFRQTLFWRSDEGFGTTSRGDVSHALNPFNLVRWEGVATVSDYRDGLYWYAGQTWYHLFRGANAISLLGFVRGESRADVPLQEYGFNLTWRRPFTREWLFLSLGPSLTWPRYEVNQKRQASWGFGAWIEMEFGDYRY